MQPADRQQFQSRAMKFLQFRRNGTADQNDFAMIAFATIARKPFVGWLTMRLKIFTVYAVVCAIHSMADRRCKIGRRIG